MTTLDSISRRWAHSLGRAMRQQNPLPSGMTLQEWGARVQPFTAESYARLWSAGWRGVPLEDVAL